MYPPCFEMTVVTPKRMLFLPLHHATELVFWVSACPIGLATARQPFITLAEGGALDIPIEGSITTPQKLLEQVCPGPRISLDFDKTERQRSLIIYVIS